MRFHLKIAIGLTLFVIVSALCWLRYAPEHWLPRIENFALVTVDGSPVQADVYIGHPTENEADAFLLVHLGKTNYLLNFDDEKFRTVRAGEFVRLHWGALFFQPVERGNWVAPMPFQNLNEFRIPTNGHVVTVKF
jgi:hypothetical protein